MSLTEQGHRCKFSELLLFYCIVISYRTELAFVIIGFLEDRRAAARIKHLMKFKKRSLSFHVYAKRLGRKPFRSIDV